MSIARCGGCVLLLGVLSTTLALPSDARAGQLVTAQTTFSPTSSTKTVGVKFNGSSSEKFYYAAAFKTTIKDGSTTLYDSITTYCVDFVHALSGNWLSATLLDIDASDPLVTTTTGGGTLVRNIGAAATILSDVLGDVYNPNALNAVQEAALQVALWEVAYDWNSAGGYATTAAALGRLSSGVFKLTTADVAIKNLAAEYLVAAWKDGQFLTTSAMFLNYPPGDSLSTTSGTSQDQLFLVPLPPGGGGAPLAVPEPSTFAMAGIAGFLGLGYRLRRSRRRED